MRLSFNKPFPLSSAAVAIRFGWVVGLFVCLFLVVFQPFGISSDQISTLWVVSAGYGLITAFSVSISTLMLRALLSKWFNALNWKIRDEMIVNLINFMVIGILNWLYSSWIFHLSITLNGLISFQIYTLSIGFIPVAFFVLLKYNRLLKMNQGEAKQANVLLSSRSSKPQTFDQALLSIKGENADEILEIQAPQLLFAESAQNYVSIVYLDETDVKRVMFRLTLQRLEDFCVPFPYLQRCHRSYLVNLNEVVKVEGNAQGLMLKLNQVDQLIPVSRTLVKFIKSKLSA